MRRPVQLERFADHNRTTPIEAPDVAEIRQATYEAGHRDGWKACEGTLEAGDIRVFNVIKRLFGGVGAHGWVGSSKGRPVENYQGHPSKRHLSPFLTLQGGLGAKHLPTSPFEGK